MRKRKLIRSDVLLKLEQDIDIGVPLARAMKNHGITMSRPATAKLVKHCKITDSDNIELANTVYKSLFPAWLTEPEQEQPDDAKYEGFFPLGRWVE